MTITGYNTLTKINIFVLFLKIINTLVICIVLGKLSKKLKNSIKI